jgi:hypothetical protein
MSTWHMKRLRIGLESPLKCGDRPFGFISRTLTFVPSHIPLTALVPAAVSLLALPDMPESYYDIQGFLEKNMRFSPFFLVDSKDDRPLFPFAESHDIKKFETLFLSARYGVAIDYAVRGARESRLFEVESIQPMDRYGKQSILEGYVFFRVAEDGANFLDRECALNGLSIARVMEQSRWGGERNKGYGDISLIESRQADTLWEAPVTLTGDAPVIHWPKEKEAPFYLLYREASAESISGKIQPVVGRIFVPGKGHGQDASEAAIVWDLGWRSAVDLAIELNVKYVTVASV